jgi:hypothetical protein
MACLDGAFFRMVLLCARLVLNSANSYRCAAATDMTRITTTTLYWDWANDDHDQNPMCGPG